MKSKNELQEIDIKNRLYYYLDDIINGTKINFNNILLSKKLYENISVITFRIKLQQVQNHCVLGSIKEMVKLNI